MAMAEWIEVLKFAALPGAILAVYFGHLRFGYKVGAHHTFTTRRFVAPGISQVTLTNLKDRSTPIFSLHAVQGDVVIELIRFESPLVLKSFESVKVDIPQVSEYRVDGEPYQFLPEFGSDSGLTKIYYSTIGKVRLCKRFAPPRVDAKRLECGRALKPAFIIKDTFNGRTYGPSVIYMVGYKTEGVWKDAFVDVAGYIDWKMQQNVIPAAALADPQLMANTLLGAAPHLQSVVVRKAPGWNLQFADGEPFNDSLDGNPFWGVREDGADGSTEDAAVEKSEG